MQVLMVVQNQHSDIAEKQRKFVSQGMIRTRFFGFLDGCFVPIYHKESTGILLIPKMYERFAPNFHLLIKIPATCNSIERHAQNYGFSPA